MYLLYADEAGNVADPSQRFFVLAGVAVYEREPHWIEQDLNQLVADLSPDSGTFLELHGHPMRTGGGAWRRLKREVRVKAISDALIIGVRQRYPKVRLFASVIEKHGVAGQDIAQLAFQQLSSRFDHYLGRRHKRNDTQRGIVIFDRCGIEEQLQALAREFKSTGHAFGKLHNLAEVPLFVDSRATRLIQLADLVAYAILRQFEFEDSQFFDQISHCFDSDGGVSHGLHVLRART